MRLCWADKTAIGLFSVAILIFFVLGVLGPNVNAFTPAWWSAFGEIAFVLGAKIFLPIWLVLRLIDFCGGGPAKRRGYVRARVLGP